MLTLIFKQSERGVVEPLIVGEDRAITEPAVLQAGAGGDNLVPDGEPTVELLSMSGYEKPQDFVYGMSIFLVPAPTPSVTLAAP